MRPDSNSGVFNEKKLPAQFFVLKKLNLNGDISRFVAQIGGEVDGGDGVLFRYARILFGNIVHGIAGGQKIQYVANGDPGALDAGFAKSNLRIGGDFIRSRIIFHLNPSMNKVWHLREWLSSDPLDDHLDVSNLPHQRMSPPLAGARLAGKKPTADETVQAKLRRYLVEQTRQDKTFKATAGELTDALELGSETPV